MKQFPPGAPPFPGTWESAPTVLQALGKMEPLVPWFVTTCNAGLRQNQELLTLGFNSGPSPCLRGS